MKGRAAILVALALWTGLPAPLVAQGSVVRSTVRELSLAVSRAGGRSAAKELPSSAARRRYGNWRSERFVKAGMTRCSP
jgi:hypothetical protein